MSSFLRLPFDVICLLMSMLLGFSDGLNCDFKPWAEPGCYSDKWQLRDSLPRFQHFNTDEQLNLHLSYSDIIKEWNCSKSISPGGKVSVEHLLSYRLRTGGCVHVQIINGSIAAFKHNRTLSGKGERQRFHSFTYFFSGWLSTQEQLRDFEFAVCLGDCAEFRNVRVPVLSMVKCRGSTSLAIVQHRKRNGNLKHFDNTIARIPKLTLKSWGNRQKKAVFRGRIFYGSLGFSTVYVNGSITSKDIDFVRVTTATWPLVHRTRLLALRQSHPTELDVNFDLLKGVQNWSHIALPAEQRGSKTGSVDFSGFLLDYPERMTMEQQVLRFKYAIYAEGQCGWADRLKDLFLLGFLVLKQETPCEEYYGFLFKPFVHYLPISGNFNDLIETIVWARQHDNICFEIAMRAQLLAMQIFRQAEQRHYSESVFSFLHEAIPHDVLPFTETSSIRAITKWP